MPILILTGTFLFWITAKGRFDKYKDLLTSSSPSASGAVGSGTDYSHGPTAFGNNIGKLPGGVISPGVITNPVTPILPNIVDWATDIAKGILEHKQ